ncbi:MAG: hypothetical protein JW874_01725 [Spirochaetales bacterium]|nr:hypothetical protein [Spirochaetales bacterium]
MKKIVAVLLLSAVLLAGLGAADLMYINLQSIENLDKYEDEVLFLINNQGYLQGFMPDEYWNAPMTRQELINKLEETYKTVLEYPEDTNQEYLLLKAVITEFLYHLNVQDYFATAVENYMAIEQLEQRDYRYKWFLGLFYAKSIKPYEAIREFDYIFERIPRDKLHPDIIADYAYAEFLSMMKKSAIADFDDYYKRTDGDPNGNSLYMAMKEKFSDYQGDDVDFSSLFFPLDREDATGYFSRLLGLWLPVSLDREINYTGLIKGASIISLTLVEPENDYRPEITYTIMILSFLDADNPETEILATLKNRKKTDLGLGDRFTTWEFSDPDIYLNMGGAHGFLTMVTSEYSEDKITRIEKPANFAADLVSEGLSFVALPEEFNRYNGTITHLILIDTCEEVLEQSRKNYIDLINRMEFE